MFNMLLILLALLHDIIAQTPVAIFTVIASILFDVILCLATRPPAVAFSIPYQSLSKKHTEKYAEALAQLIMHYKKQGKKVVIRFVGNRGSGKSAIVSHALRLLTCAKGATDFATITFIGVRQYCIMLDDKKIKVVHIDPDVKGHQRLTALHSPMWDVLLLEHGTNRAFREHNDIIKKMGDDVVDLTVTITHERDNDVRAFTMTSVSGKPVETPPPCKWKGELTDKNFSPDIRLTKQQVRYLRRKFGKKKLVILSVESSCDDTCITIRIGDTNIYVLQKQCLQTGQRVGKGGIDPIITAEIHAENFKRALKEIRDKLQDHGLKIDLVSVTQGPGQAFALLQGIKFAQTIASGLNVPIIYLDHIMGHAISPLLSSSEEAPKYPYLVFVVSGGHTVILLVDSPVNMRIVYTTPDDALGEVIDKVCRAMGISSIPAGLMAEKIMNEFLDGKKELWTGITAQTKNDDIKHLTPDVEERQILTKFRDALKELDKCVTPSAIKLQLCKLIKEQKLRDCDRLKLLATYVQHFGSENLTPNEVKKMMELFSGQWNETKDGHFKDIHAYLKTYQGCNKYDAVVHECKIVSLLHVLENILHEKKGEIKDACAFLHAFLHHFQMLDKVTTTDVAYFYTAFPNNEKPQEWIKEAVVDESYITLVSQYTMPKIPFSTFMRNFDDMTSITQQQQQFYCALLHSVSLTYLNKNIQEALAKFPYVKYISLGGGVACNRFLQIMLKALLEINGRRFTIVPREYCADNAHMMWKLVSETLRHLFANGGECTCGDHDAECQSCERLRDTLLQHKCGTIRGPIDESKIMHCAGNRWNDNADEQKFANDLNVLYMPSESMNAQSSDAKITVEDMHLFLDNVKNRGENSIWSNVFKAFNERWQTKMDPCVKVWSDANCAVLSVQDINEYKVKAIMVLILTNFFGHGYEVFAKGRTDEKTRAHLQDVNHIRALIRPVAQS